MLRSLNIQDQLQNENIKNLDSKLSNISNPNLLINPDFRINQRKLTSYDASAKSLYFVDRWMLAYATATINSTDIHIANASASNESFMMQFIENAFLLASKNVTLSINVKAISGDASKIGIGVYKRSGATFVQEFINSIELTNGLNYVTISLPENIGTEDYPYLFIYVSTPVGGTIDIEYIKMELGKLVTPFVPTNPYEELLKCGKTDDSSMLGYKSYTFADFLPLATGGTIGNWIEVLCNNNTDLFRTRIITGSDGSSGLVNNNADYSELRQLSIRPSSVVEDPTKALQYNTKIDGSWTTYNVLHSGNSASVTITADDSTAPTDTNTLWVY